MVVASNHFLFKQFSVRALKWAKNINIKWLQEMRGICRHAKTDNCILLAKSIKLCS